eukprot:scaffold137229_cov359-Phaeocystis_antarctica.AAC.1
MPEPARCMHADSQSVPAVVGHCGRLLSTAPRRGGAPMLTRRCSRWPGRVRAPASAVKQPDVG